jgi:hypothetical protein
MSANMTNKVTVLITAESIIAGFMIAYGALNGQLLVHWSHYGGSYMMTTYIAGIVIYTIVLTCFVSIVLLFNSLSTNNYGNPSIGATERVRRYDAGYDLFLMAILGSAVFVVTNGISIHHFTITGQPIGCFPLELANVLFKEFLFYAGVLLVLLVLLLRFPCLLPLNHHALIIGLFFFTAVAVVVANYYVPGACACVKASLGIYCE